MSEAVAGTQDSRGEWQPTERPATAPIWAWPPRPLAALKWLVAYPGYLFPWNAIFLAIAVLTWAYLTPELARMAEFRLDWIAEIYVRNLALLVLWAGGWHLRLYTFKGQGSTYKYNPKWLHDKSPTFLWGSQLRENMCLNLASACAVWTAYEVAFLWGYANEFLPTLDWRTEPAGFALMVLAVMVWRETHFYWTHRLLHWKPVYRSVHYVHHKNVNVGPWSGLAMHPVEHVINFSSVLLFLVVPAHPLLVILTLQQHTLTPAPGHAGFDRLIVKRKAMLPGDFFHYLHHRYFDCNYGSPLVPFDRWFASFHDGSRESHARMQRRWGAKRA